MIARIALAALSFLWAASASAEPVTTIRSSGSPDNRLDIAVLGDGYTAAEISSGKYALDVETAVTGLFAQDPYSDYRDYFNVHRVDVTSDESGADHPSLGIFRQTALDATYECAGITRLICVNVSKVNAVLTRSITDPAAREVILVIVNDPQYGGSGGAVAVSSTNFAAVEVVLHELGHSLGLLADEYGGPPPPSCVNTVEPSAVNVTSRTVRSQIKWNVWIDPATPIPTTERTDGIPGLYEGAQYCDTGLYRPTFDSKMRSLNAPFYQINTEQLIKRFYNYVSPIDAATPSGSSVTISPGSSQRFTLSTPLPLSHSLDAVWRLDGTIAGSGPEYMVSSAAGSGVHVVEVLVVDRTPLVRSDPAGVLRAIRTWTVTIGSVGLVETTVSPVDGRRGELVTLRATVSPAGVSGAVQFLVNGASIPGAAAYTSSTGVAMQQYFLTLVPGSYEIKALFSSGDPAFSDSAGTSTLTVTPANATATVDFDGDLATDVAVYRSSSGEWFILNSGNGTGTTVNWGTPSLGDISVAGDYDGDGRTDVAVYRGATGQWFIANSSGGPTTVRWGAPSLGDIPVPADYDRDGRTDIAVYRRSTGEWFVLDSNGGSQTVTWGAPSLGDIPVPADYDGDGRADIAVYRNTTGQWFILNSQSGAAVASWGAPSLGDIPVPADYDGDGRADIAIFRNTTGEWFIANTSGGAATVAWGAPSLDDTPVPADYDGDGRADIAIYRKSTGAWIVNRSTGGASTINWGAPALGDIPADLPQALR